MQSTFDTDSPPPAPQGSLRLRLNCDKQGLRVVLSAAAAAAVILSRRKRP